MSAELRRSRRVSGLEHEERGLQCFICQMDIEIDTLPRCQRTSCCGAFMHKLCHREMVTRVRTCGNCCCENAEFKGEVVLETDEEMEEEDNPFDTGTIPVLNVRVVRELTEYRNDESRYLYTHYEGSVHWNALPFDIPPHVWHDYYSMLERFTNLFLYENMYVHRRVVVPCDVTSEMRAAVYRMFFHNMPFSVFNVVRTLRFGLFCSRQHCSPCSIHYPLYIILWRRTSLLSRLIEYV